MDTQAPHLTRLLQAVGGSSNVHTRSRFPYVRQAISRSKLLPFLISAIQYILQLRRWILTLEAHALAHTRAPAALRKVRHRN